MFNYLYYKLYQASLKSSLRDIPAFMTAVSFGGLLSVNIIVLFMMLAKLDIFPFLFSSKEQTGVFALILIMLPLLYYRKKRIRLILQEYSQESNRARVRGNIIVSVYVALSFLLMFIVPLFRAGKL
jgi:hypothetical protein